MYLGYNRYTNLMKSIGIDDPIAETGNHWFVIESYLFILSYLRRRWLRFSRPKAELRAKRVVNNMTPRSFQYSGLEIHCFLIRFLKGNDRKHSPEPSGNIRARNLPRVDVISWQQRSKTIAGAVRETSGLEIHRFLRRFLKGNDRKRSPKPSGTIRARNLSLVNKSS